MIRRFIVLIIALMGIAAATFAASAHPHVWVTIRSELLYALDGSATAVRHAWTFDDMFSAFATTGLQKTNGTFSRDTLQALAKVNGFGITRRFLKIRLLAIGYKRVVGLSNKSYGADREQKEKTEFFHGIKINAQR